METKWYFYIIVCVVGYVVGSLNFAKLFAKLKAKDISKMGSGNPGTMNMLRSVGIGLGVATLVADILKAVLVCILAKYMCGDLGIYSAGLCVILGHNYSMFLKFKGGKGVACAIGIFAVANPIATAVAFVLLVIFLFTVKYGSIGSFLFIIGLSVTECIIHRAQPELVVVILLLMSLILFSHRSNVARLIKGNENKLELAKYIKAAIDKKRSKKLAATATVGGNDAGEASVENMQEEESIASIDAVEDNNVPALLSVKEDSEGKKAK